MSESHMYAPMKMTFYGINVHIHQKGLHEKGFYLLLIKRNQQHLEPFSVSSPYLHRGVACEKGLSAVFFYFIKYHLEPLSV